MADTELSIQIEAEASSANQGLSTLDKSLENIQGTLKGISDALGGISGKIDPISRAMNRLSNDIEKLNPDAFKRTSSAIKQSASEIDKSTQQVEKSINGMVRSINDSFKINNKAALSELKQSLKELYNLEEKASFADKMGDTRTFEESKNAADAMRSQIEKIITDYGRVEKTGVDSYRRIAEYVSSLSKSRGKIYLEPEIKSEFIDKQAEKMRRVLGNAFTFNNKDITTNFDSIMQEIKAEFQEFDWSDSLPKAFGELVGRVSEGREKFLGLNDAIKQGQYDAEGLTHEIDDMTSKISSMADTNVGNFMQSTMQGFEGDMADAYSSVEKVSDALQSMGDSASTEGLKSALSEIPSDIKAVEPAIDEVQTRLEEAFSGMTIDGMNEYIATLVNDFEDAKSALSSIESEDIKIPPIDTTALQTIPEEVEKISPAIEEVQLRLQDAFSDLTIEDFNEQIANAVNEFEDVKQELRTIEDVEIKLPPLDTSALESSTEKVKDDLANVARTDTWSNVVADIEKTKGDFDLLSNSIGDTNAQMQILQDISNRVNGAMSSTKSGKMLIDTDNMRIANEELHQAEESLRIFYDQFNKPLEMDAEQPKSELGQLYNRAKELSDLIDSMRNNRIQFDTSDMRRSLKELDSVNGRIKELEGRDTSSTTGTTDIMAQLVAMQHELNKASQAFSRFGDIAKNAFLKCLTPLKLFKHEFEEIKGLVTFVSRIGSAFAMISKPITKVFNSLQKQASSAFSKIQKAWGKVMRTFTFMLIRKAITKVLSDINDASVSLAKFSKSIGTPFNDTMSLITSDLRYIAASIMALFSTILNAALPTFNSIVDAIVAVINKVNMFLAILTNAKSYTIAKKKIVDYTEATKDASKAVKQLTMGIDELNILNDKSSSNDTSAEDMFDWQEIPTPTIDIPEWLKWLKELLKKLWDAIMEMLKALWDAIKKAWVNVRDFFIAAFKHLIESIVGLILDIIRDLTRVFKTKEFQEFLERIFRIIAKIAELIATIVDRIRIAWNYNDLGFRILMDILAILNTIAKHIENMLDMSIEWAKTLNFIPLFEAIEKGLRQVNYAIDQIGYTVERVWGIVLGILKLAIEDYIPRLIGVLGNVAEGIGNLFGQLNNAWDATDFTNKFVAAFDGIMQAIIPHIEAIGVYFKNWASEVDFEPLLKSFLKLAKSLKPVAEFIGGVFEDVVTKYILPMVQHIIEEVLPMIADGISHFANTVDWGQLRKGLAKVIEGFEHMQVSIGEGVAMAIDRIGQALAKFINSDNFQKFLDNLANFLKSISPELVSNVLTAIGLAILRIADALVKFVNSELFQKFLRSLINFLTYKDANRLATYLLNIAKAIALFKFAAFVSKGLSGFMGFLAVIAKIKEIKALKDIATSVQNIGTAAESAGGTLSGFGTALKTIGSTIGGVIKTIGGIGAIIGGSILAIKEFIDMWVNGWDIIKTILEALGIALAAVGAVILGAPAAVAAAVAGIIFVVSQIALAIKENWNAIGEFFANLGKAIAEGVETMIQGGKDLIKGLWKGITETIGDAFKWIKEHIFEPIVNAFKSLFGIHSPSTVFEEFGKNLIEGLKIGIENAWNEFLSWISGIWTEFVSWAVETWNTIVTNIANAWNTFLEKIQGVWATVSGWFETTWGTFKSWVSEIWLSIVQTIMDAWNGITEFLSGIWQTIYDTAVNAFNGVADFIKGVWDSVKQFTSEIWNNIWDFLGGLWENIKNTATSLFGEIKDFVSSVWDSIEGTWNSIWNDIFNTLASWWNTIREDALNGWNNAVSFVMALWDGIKEKWDGIWDGIKTTLLEIWDSIRQEAQQGWDKAVQVVTNLWNGIHEAWDKMWGGVLNMLSDWWNKVKTTATSVWGDITDKLAGIWDGVEEAWHDIWNGIGKFIGGVINGIMGALEGLANGVIEVINCVIRGINSLSIDIPETPFSDGFTLGFSIPELSKHSFPRINIPAYASGGFPEDGLFYANHNELIGSFNGRTAVANNDMITDGIAQAVSSQLVPILTDIAQSSRKTADKDMTLRVDSREIARANKNGQSKLGKSLVSFT